MEKRPKNNGFMDMPDDAYEHYLLTKKMLAGEVPAFDAFLRRLAYGPSSETPEVTADQYMDDIAGYAIKAIRAFVPEGDPERITLHRVTDPVTGCGPLISFVHHGHSHSISYEALRDVEDTDPQRSTFEYCYYTAQGVWPEFVSSPFFSSPDVIASLCERVRAAFPSAACAWEDPA